jgi:hypothetical protein
VDCADGRYCCRCRGYFGVATIGVDILGVAIINLRVFSTICVAIINLRVFSTICAAIIDLRVFSTICAFIIIIGVANVPRNAINHIRVAIIIYIDHYSPRGWK